MYRLLPMNRSIRPIIIFFLLPVSLAALDFNSQMPPEELAAALMAEMSDQDALGQTFMLGWVGAEPSPLIMDWIRERRIGGVKIFGWNTANTVKLAETVGRLQKAALAAGSGIPLLVATDQEGGMVRHVKGDTSETPGGMAIGASGRPRDAFLSGYYIGKEIALLGINMNFAPVVDLYTNHSSALMGTRAYGDDPVRAGVLGTAFMRGMLAAGVIPTAKHFPGHGDTPLDSHGTLPVINISLDTMMERELTPYKMLSRAALPAVMSGHLAFPKTPGDGAPASLSPWFITGLLRDDLGYDGVVVTDDIMMNGATAFSGSVSGAAKLALAAGNDIILLSKTPGLGDRVWTLLAQAMRDDESFRSTVRAAAHRILLLKLKYLRGDGSVPMIPDISLLPQGLPDREGKAYFLGLAARSVTFIKGDLPLPPERAGKVFLAGQYQDFFAAGKAAYPGASAYWYSPGAERDMLSYAKNADTVIFCVSGPSGLPILDWFKGAGKKVIVFSVQSPAVIEKTGWIDGAVAVYASTKECFAAGFSAMRGGIPAEGRLPVEGR